MHGNGPEYCSDQSELFEYFSTRLVPLSNHAKHRNHGYYHNASLIAHFSHLSADARARRLQLFHSKENVQLSSSCLSGEQSRDLDNRRIIFQLFPYMSFEVATVFPSGTVHATTHFSRHPFQCDCIHTENHKELPIH